MVDFNLDRAFRLLDEQRRSARRGRRAIDLFIAATAVALGLPLYTRNPSDFAGLSDILEIITV